MRSRLLALALVFGCAAVALSGQSRAAKALNIYVIDVEGGNATLFVSPTGESLLIDTGNAGAGAVRDATRIMEAARLVLVLRIRTAPTSSPATTTPRIRNRSAA